MMTSRNGNIFPPVTSGFPSQSASDGAFDIFFIVSITCCFTKSPVIWFVSPRDINTINQKSFDSILRLMDLYKWKHGVSLLVRSVAEKLHLWLLCGVQYRIILHHDISRVYDIMWISIPTWNLKYCLVFVSKILECIYGIRVARDSQSTL